MPNGPKVCEHSLRSTRNNRLDRELTYPILSKIASAASVSRSVEVTTSAETTGSNAAVRCGTVTAFSSHWSRKSVKEGPERAGLIYNRGPLGVPFGITREKHP